MSVVVARGHPAEGRGLTIDAFPEIKKVTVGLGSFRGDMQYITLNPAETATAAAALINAGKAITQEDHNG